MAEEGMITMNEFKTVVEQFRSDQKKMIEVMNYRFDGLESRMDRQERKSDTMMEQIALLHEGQTDLRIRVGMLEKGQTELVKTVASLEKKVDTIVAGQE